MRIAHIICRDKFTAGYINFFKMRVPQHQNSFITLSRVDEKDSLKLLNELDVFYIDMYRKIRRSKSIMKVLREADCIIVSGLFESVFGVAFLPESFLRKTYIHLWGGDFYCFSEKYCMREYMFYLQRMARKYCFKKCSGLLFLIDGEYEKFEDIVGLVKPHFVAPMPEDPLRTIEYKEYALKRSNSTLKVLVGNSAIESNQHIDVFHKLKHFTLEKMEVWVPLSYGRADYREKVIIKGKEILGNAFKPIVEFMPYEKYMEFLSTIDIGIFNNNRQQAMGNINALLALGAKVFLRRDTSMWSNYCHKGYTIYSVEDLGNISMEELSYIDEKMKENNTRVFENSNSLDEAQKQWNEVLDCILGNRE